MPSRKTPDMIVSQICRRLACISTSSKLGSVPIGDPRSCQQGENSSHTQEDSEWQHHLQVSSAPPEHYRDTHQRAAENGDQDRQDCEPPAKVSSHHHHHFYVTKAHGFNAAQFLPDKAHQPERSTAGQRSHTRSDQRDDPDRVVRRKKRRQVRQNGEVRRNREIWNEQPGYEG